MRMADPAAGAAAMTMMVPPAQVLPTLIPNPIQNRRGHPDLKMTLAAPSLFAMSPLTRTGRTFSMPSAIKAESSRSTLLRTGTLV